MKSAIFRFLGSAQNKVGISANGAAGVWYAPGEFLDLGTTTTLIFSGRCVIKVRGSAAGHTGGFVGFVSDESGGGGGQGAYNEVGVLVIVTPDGTYTAIVAGVSGANTEFTTPTATRLQLLGGNPGSVAPSPIGGLGGLATIGAGGVTGQTGASGFGGGSPAKGADASLAGASGGAGNDGGAGGDGGGTYAAGEPGGPAVAPNGGGSGREGAGVVLTGTVTRAGQGGGGQGAGNVLNGQVGSTLYTFANGLGRITVEIISIG